MHVYDKATFHDESVQALGLPAEHATHHTLFFLRWLVDHDLLSEECQTECASLLAGYRQGTASMYAFYGWWDNCLVSDMLSTEGNAFADAYFDFDHGQYLADYAQVLQRQLPSEFHVQFTDENYRAIGAVIDRRFAAWHRKRQGDDGH